MISLYYTFLAIIVTQELFCMCSALDTLFNEMLVELVDPFILLIIDCFLNIVTDVVYSSSSYLHKILFEKRD